MNTANIIAGLTILSRTCPGGYGVTAEHDAISHCDVKLSEAEVTELLSLGWFQPDGGAMLAKDSNDGTARPYDLDEGWMAYV